MPGTVQKLFIITDTWYMNPPFWAICPDFFICLKPYTSPPLIELSDARPENKLKPFIQD